MFQTNRLPRCILVASHLVAAALIGPIYCLAQNSPAVSAHIAAAANDIPKTESNPSVPALSQAALPASDNDYRIGAGDVLAISVWREPEVSVPAIIVRPDGKITVPLVKDIGVAGLTPAEAEKAITRALVPLITEANVTVIVTAIHSKKIYVIGAVKKEGPLVYTHKMTVMQALTEAGGLTDYAKRKKIYVLRAQNGKQTRIRFDYDAVLNGKSLEHVWLVPDDTLVVPH